MRLEQASPFLHGRKVWRRSSFPPPYYLLGHHLKILETILSQTAQELECFYRHPTSSSSKGSAAQGNFKRSTQLYRPCPAEAAAHSSPASRRRVAAPHR